MTIVDQLNIFIENRPGQLRSFCETLRKGGINMRAILLPDSREAGVARLVVDDAELAIEVLKKARILAVKSPALAVETRNHPGALSDLAEMLAQGGVEIQYAYGAGQGDHATLILGVSDLERAQQILAT
ncbi:MAG: acetolactate synthase [Gemmatimonadetes bacterium]|nr:acetolactate synthase [Gemmatimonadota bacterium]